MLERRLDEAAEWQLASSGRPEVLHGLWKSHRFDALSRFLLPRLTADFAQPGDLVRLVSASLVGTHVIGIANLTRRRALLPNPARYAAALLIVCGAPAVPGFLLGLRWPPAIFLTIGLLTGAWIFAEAVSQLRHYVISGSAGSFTLWRSIRERVATRPLPPPDNAPREEPNWTYRLDSAVRGTLRDTETCPIGHVAVADGKLSPCEPFRLLDDAPANAIDAPPGRYPVFVALACSEYYDGVKRTLDRRVSHAWAKIDDSKPMLWRLARQGRTPIEVGVDSAIACFTSVEAARRIAASWDRGGQFGYVDELGHEIVSRMRQVDRGGWHCAAIGEDLVAFSSGAGDGVYPVYLGTAAGGETVAVAIDFEIEPERVEEPWRGRYEIIWS